MFPALVGERLVPLLEGRCGCRVSVENDGTCAGLAEFYHGSLKDYDSALCVVLGTGIGAALFLDGKIWRGSHLCGPELSLIRADGKPGVMLPPSRPPRPPDVSGGRFLLPYGHVRFSGS